MGSPSAGQIKIQRQVSVEDGLVQSQVMSLLEDQDGFLWIGTLGGLSRWDGMHFVNYTEKDGLPAPGIHCIAEKADGSIWMGTNGGGVSVFRNGHFSTIGKNRGLPNLNIRVVAHDSNDETFLGTDKGLALLSGKESDSSKARIELNGHSITSIRKTKSFGWLIASYKKGIFLYKDGRIQPFLPGEKKISEGVRLIYESMDSTLYFAVDGQGVGIYKKGIIKWLNKDNGFVTDRIQFITESHEGKMYFASVGSGVVVWDKIRMESISEANGLANNTVWSIIQNRNKVLIFGTWGGINFYDHGAWTSYNKSSGLSSNIILSIHESKDDQFYFGTFGGGVNVLKQNRFSILPNVMDQTVWSIFEDSRGLYFGTQSKGVETIENGKHGLLKPALDARIYAISKGPGDSIYIGTREGLEVYDGRRVTEFSLPNKWDRQFVYSIYDDPRDCLYLGTRNGLLRIFKDHTDTLDIKRGLSNNHIWSIYKNRRGLVFVGTNGGGLNILQDNSIKVIDATNGLSDNTVYGIQEDEFGKMYVTTNRGVNVLTFSDSTYSVYSIHSSDGLIGDECSQGAFFKDRRGRLWIGTNRGVSCYDPNKVPFQSSAPRVHLTRLRVFEDDLDLKNLPKSFQYNQNYLKFDFVGIHLTAPSKVIYRYRMSGVDPDWVETPRTFVQYSNLNDGDYAFEIKARNEFGVWSDPLNFSFRVNPPFWETWWFILLIILLSGSLIGYLVYNRILRKLAVDRLRVHIAADFHDTIGAGLTQMHYLSRTALMRSEEPERMIQNLKTIDDISNKLYEDVRDIIWLINPKRDSLHELILRLAESFDDTIEQQGIEFVTENLDLLTPLRLPMDNRRHIYMIFKEAINNCLKYSGCSKIELRIEMSGRAFQIKLKDNGRGFETGAITGGGTGLAQMHDRAKQTGGSLVINHQSGQGVELIYKGSV